MSWAKDSHSQESLAYFTRIGLPIVAIATATGGPVAVIRVSGKALEFLEPLIGRLPEPNTFKYRSLTSVNQNNESHLDNALVLNFQAPASFTGENVIEIQSHGVPALLESIVEQIVSLGALRALPGEFSFRAVLNNKMTLEQAESLQTALSTEGLSAGWASHLLATDAQEGVELESRLSDAIKSLEAARGRVEAAIDFPEAEAEQAADVAAAKSRLFEVKKMMGLLLTSYEEFCKTAGDPRVAIVGEPNVGKSTLLNLLVGGKKALVSEIAGTTRDVVETRIKLPSGRWVRLMDTAGLRQFDEQSAHDRIEKAGIELSLAAIEKAQIVIWVRDASRKEASDFSQRIKSQIGSQTPVIEIASHADLGDGAQKNSFNFKLLNGGTIDFCLSELDKSMDRLSTSSKGEEHFGLVISRRQGQLLQAALAEIERATEACEGRLPLELAGENIRSAEVLIKRAIGRGVGEEYLEQIFRQFCLGK